VLLLRNCHSATAGWKSAAVLSVWDEAMLGGLRAAGVGPTVAATKEIPAAAMKSAHALAMRRCEKKRF
jgi:hypothetical protein